MLKKRKGLRVRYENGMKCYRLYNTDILTVVIKDNVFILNTDGWKTNHTKNCMNDNLPEGFSVQQKNFKWFLNTPSQKVEFFDGIVVYL